MVTFTIVQFVFLVLLLLIVGTVIGIFVTALLSANREDNDEIQSDYTNIICEEITNAIREKNS